jgi:hypothetical protein
MFLLKLRASGLHLLISAAIAVLVLGLVYFGWYRGVLSTTEGVGTILLIMLGIDVTLGPLMTLLVYKPKKKSLKFDLTVIGLLQLGFLAYGIYTVQIARPAYVVFVKDRFESVAVADWGESAQEALEKTPNPVADRDIFGPKFIASKAPEDIAIRQELMMTSVAGGADLPQLPQYYVLLESELSVVAKKALSIAELKALNPNLESSIDAAVAASGQTVEKIGFLPLKGKQADASVFVDKASGKVLAMHLFKPW